VTAVNALVLGGTGLISAGIVKHLLARGVTVTVYNRARRAAALPPEVRRIAGDRADRAGFEAAFARARYDVVIDMICFSPDDAASTIRAFGGRCEQLQLCSTVCTYGGRIPPHVLVDERLPQEPLTPYARDKLACERLFEQADQEGRVHATILRPSNTYGPGAPLIDQLECDGSTWDRVARGLPVLLAGDGLGLWQSTHRDDCGQLFAFAAGNPRTYGQAYNATRDEVFTWRDYYRQAAAALDARARLVLAPAPWLIAQRPERFAFLREVSQFHGAYSSAKARADVPEFQATIGFEAGARETFADLRRRGAWRDSAPDVDYQRLVDQALALGFPLVDA
jgi:nucleoside-diphosphate-sugar epimerase